MNCSLGQHKSLKSILPTTYFWIVWYSFVLSSRSMMFFVNSKLRYFCTPPLNMPTIWGIINVRNTNNARVLNFSSIRGVRLMQTSTFKRWIIRVYNIDKHTLVFQNEHMHEQLLQLWTHATLTTGLLRVELAPEEYQLHSEGCRGNNTGHWANIAPGIW